jgi:hypothetical protein
MKSDNPLKHFVLAFVLAVICYAIFYKGIEHRRTRKGPWEVAFTRGSEGEPAIVVNQPSLAISNVQILFPEATLPATNSNRAIFFSEPRPVPFDLPFGKCVFMDTTFLPGTVTFQIFGHEIELLPRVLIIDRQERPWLPEAVITLHPLAEIPHPGEP